MNLPYLLKGFYPTELAQPIEILDLALDSRKVKTGDLFFACIGTHLDGRLFIEEAVERGAVVVLAEGDYAEESMNDVPIIFIPSLSKKIGAIAARFYQNPNSKLLIVGITGTNGKTSTSHFIAEALTSLNFPCGVIGTLGNGLYGKIQESNLTTPDAITLQKNFQAFVKDHAKFVAMEVSSHSIDQGRMNGVQFEIGVFTNLTRDHLDYHGTMENYGNTKKKLFAQAETKTIVINADDAFGKNIIAEFENKKPLYIYSLEKQDSINAVYVENITLDIHGIHADLISPWGKGELFAKLIGKFNLSNLLAAFTSLCILKIPFTDALAAISVAKPVPGRMQIVTSENKPLVIVDYAHTPDALEKVLIALREHCTGKLICIFGCGGDRDRGKRPLMAEIAEKFSDVVMVTDDNPRTEDAEQIFSDIFTGFSDTQNILKEHDRAQAIQTVLKTASIQDCILIAGKGAEPYQIIGQKKFKFSDAEVVTQFYKESP